MIGTTGVQLPADRTAARLRAGLLALTTVAALGCAFELYSERHWHSPTQLIAWAATSTVLLAVVLALLPGRGALLAARILAVAVLGASAYGILVHVLGNYEAGPLDPRFADGGWDGLSALMRLRFAVTKTVGDAPTLAPGMLAQAALLLLLSTIGRGKSVSNR